MLKNKTCQHLEKKKKKKETNILMFPPWKCMTVILN